MPARLRSRTDGAGGPHVRPGRAVGIPRREPVDAVRSGGGNGGGAPRVQVPVDDAVHGVVGVHDVHSSRPARCVDPRSRGTEGRRTGRTTGIGGAAGAGARSLAVWTAWSLPLPSSW